MKKLGFALFGLVVLLIAAVLIGPSFVDWNAHKGRITSEVRKLTGRALIIDGDISLVLLPAPALSAAKVRFANIEGGSSPSMIELESLDVRVALIPLVRGQVQVESVVLVRPTIVVEVLPDGRKNWDFIKPDAPAPSGGPRAEAGGDMAGQVRLDSVRISDGTLIYRDAAAGQEERITDLNAEIVAGSLNGPFAVSGDAVVRGVKSGFKVTVGQLVSAGATSLNASLHLPAAGAKAKFGGAVSLHPDSTSLRGRIKAEGENLASLVALLSSGAQAPGAKAPGVLARPFVVETEVSADARQVSAADLIFRLGETSIEGDLRIRLDPSLDVRMSVSASRLDLDKLLAPAPGGQTGATTAPDQRIAGFALPVDVTAALEVTIDALVYRGQVVRQMLVSIGLAEGRLKVSQALALLPGGSDVSLTGVLAPARTAAGPDLRFNGRVEAASDNLRGMLEWLDVNVAAVPAGRLRRMSLSARVDATTRQVTLNEIDLRVDVSRATGGIAVALRERPGFGVGLAIDKLNLDAYLPAEGTAWNQDKAGGDAAAPGAGETAAGLGAAAVLAGFDANLDIKLGRLSLRGVIMRDLHLDATLQQGAVTLREALVGDLAGSRVRIAGSVADLATNPSVQIDVELSVSDPVRLAKLANLKADALSRIGAFDLTGKVKGSPEHVGFDVEIKALGGRFGLAGTAQPLAAPLGFDVTVAAKHPSLAKLARAFDRALALDPRLGGLDLSARVSGTPVKLEVAGLSGTLGPAALSGSFAADLSGPKPAVADVDLAVTLRHPNLAELARSVSPDLALDPGLGGVDLKGRITGGAMAFRVSDLAGRLGRTDLSGTLGVDLSGPKPAIDIDLSTGEVPLAALMAPAAGKGTAPAGASGPSAGGGTSAKAGRRWSNEPIDVSALNEVNAEIKLSSKALLLDNLRLDNALIEASLTDGLLDLRKLNATFYDGALSVQGKVDARKTLEARLALTVVELDLARLLKDLAESDRVSGPLNVNASLSTRGRSEAELVSALTGKGDVSGTLKVTAKQEEKVGSLLLGILGQRVKEVRGVIGATNALFNDFADAPAPVSGNFTVERGVIETTDLRVDGRQATALTQGTADLPAWQLDTRTDVYRAANPGTPYLTVNLRGPLDAPNPRVRGAPSQTRQQPASATAPVPSAGPQPSGTGQTQPAPETTSPEDILKKQLRKTLKGLFGN